MDRAEELRRKIALYREYLAAGVDAERAASYIREIRRLQSELDQIESDADKRN